MARSAHTLYLDDGPAQGSYVNYPAKPNILVICRDGVWHDYLNVKPSQQPTQLASSNHYRHSEDCRCR